MRSGCNYTLTVVQSALSNLFTLSDSSPPTLQASYTGDATPLTTALSDVTVVESNGAPVTLNLSALQVAGQTTVVVTFNKPVDPATVNAQTFVVTSAGPVAGSYAVSGNTVTFTPSAFLQGGATYTVSLRASGTGFSGIADLAGNSLTANLSGTFTVDGSVPSVVGVTHNTPDLFVITFTQPIDPSSLVASTVSTPGSVQVCLSSSGSCTQALYGSLSVSAANPDQVVFTTFDAVPGGSVVLVTVTTQVRSTAQIPLASVSVSNL